MKLGTVILTLVWMPIEHCRHSIKAFSYCDSQKVYFKSVLYAVVYWFYFTLLNLIQFNYTVLEKNMV